MPSLSMIFTIMIGVIMFFSLLKGFIVGFKKNLYHLFSRILFWVMFFVLTNTLITPKLLDNESLYATIQRFANLPSDFTTLGAYLVDIISTSANIDKDILQDVAIYNTALAAAFSIVKIVFLIIFAIIWAIISTIIYKIFFRRFCKLKMKNLEKLQKRKEALKADGKENKKLNRKVARGEKMKKHIKRNRNIGLLTGLINGTISSFLIMSLINSMVLVLPDLSKKEDISASTETTSPSYNSIYDYIVEKYPNMQDVVDYIAEYQQSNLIGITALKINGKRADTLFIDSIISGKSNNYTVAIREEMESVIQIAVYAFTLTNGFNMNSVDFAALNTAQQEDLKNILVVLSNDNLVKNLASAVVGVALTLDSVKAYIPEDIDLSGVSTIDWSKELQTIANMVSDVYSLQKDAPTDFKNIDINNLDPDKVESLCKTFASLQTFQIAAKVGSYYAVDNFLSEKDENGNITNKEQLDVIKEHLADVVWNEDVESLSTLYRKYGDIAATMNNNKDENGKIDILKGLTQTKSEDFNQVVDTIMETTFMMNTFGDVLDIVKKKYIPAEYADLISPNITQSTQFSGEIKTLFSLIKDLSNNGKDDITKLDSFNFASLNNISTDTIMNSELLTHAMINIFISSSQGKGIAGNILGEYVSVPDSLQEELTKDEKENYHYNLQWYDTKDEKGNVIKQGELHIMLDTLKNVGSQVKTLKYPVTTLPDILEAINPKQLTQSKVLHYTLSKYILNSSGNFISVPVSAIDSSLNETVNGTHVDVIRRQEIEDMISTLTNPEIIDTRNFLKYYLLDKNGNKTDVEISYTDIKENTKYMAELAIDNPETILSAFLSDSLIKNDDNLNTLFSSSILRTTISSFINKYDEYITVPLSVSASSLEKVYSKDKNEDGSDINTIKDLRVLSKKECKNLLKTLSKLDLSFDSLENISKDPMSLIDKFSKKTETDEKVYNAEMVKSIFDAANSEYSEIMHATFSKYIKSFSESSTASFALVIPDEVMTLPAGFVVPADKNPDDYNYISSNEVVNLIKAVYYISSSSSSIFDSNNFDLYSTFIDNENVGEAFDSDIIRASISKYIQDNETTKEFIVIPEVDSGAVAIKHLNETEIKVITAQEFNNMIDGLKALQRNTGLTDSDLFNVSKYSLNAINNSMNELVESEILHCSISKKILSLNNSTGFALVIPQDVVSKDVISKNEIKALFNTINLLTGDSTIDNISSSISYDEALDKFENQADNGEFFDSLIIRASITDYISKIGSGVVVPYDDNVVNTKSYNYKDNSSINVLTKQEMVSLIDMYKTIKNKINKGKPESEKINGQDALKVNNLTMNSIYEIVKEKQTDSYISGIFKASLSDALFSNNKDTVFIGVGGNFFNEQNDLLVENEYQTGKYYYVNYDEIVKLFHSLSLIVGDLTYDNLSTSFDSTAIFSLDIDQFFESDIISSTMSVKVYDLFNQSSALTFLDRNDPITSLEPHTYSRYDLSKSEIINFYKAILAFSDGNNNIDNFAIDFDEIINKCQSDNQLIEKMCNSYLMNYNVIKYIKEQNSTTFNNMLVVDNYEHEGHNHEYNYYWYNEDNQKGNLEHFLKSLVELYNNEDYKTALTNPSSEDISITTFANSSFINIMTNDNVLCDSLPNIISQLAKKLNNEQLNTDLLFIPDRFVDEKDYNNTDLDISVANWKKYWKGENADCSDGQLHLFFEAIDAGNALTSGIQESQLKALIDSDITRPMAKAYIKTIANSYNAYASILGKEQVTIPSDDASNEQWYQLIVDLVNKLS